MSDIKFIKGGLFTDHRGLIAYCNDFDMQEIRRSYCITHSDTSVIRAWHAHQDERRWFVVPKGAFVGSFVKIDNCENPSHALDAEIYTLTADKLGILCIPTGYANGFKSIEPDSIMMVYSDKLLSEALLDSWRYDVGLWIDWSKY